MITLVIERHTAPAGALTDIKALASRFPGPHTLELRVGDRTLRLGDGWRYDASEACLAALSEFGTPEVLVGC